MSARTYTVGVILDPEAGDSIRDIAARQPVWVSPSPANNPVVERMRSEVPGSFEEVTLWSASIAPQSETEWRSVVGDIDLHHGEYSHDPPVSVIEVFGPDPSPAAQAAFSSFGFTAISATSYGFSAGKGSGG